MVKLWVDINWQHKFHRKRTQETNTTQMLPEKTAVSTENTISFFSLSISSFCEIGIVACFFLLPICENTVWSSELLLFRRPWLISTDFCLLVPFCMARLPEFMLPDCSDSDELSLSPDPLSAYGWSDWTKNPPGDFLRNGKRPKLPERENWWELRLKLRFEGREDWLPAAPCAERYKYGNGNSKVCLKAVCA